MKVAFMYFRFMKVALLSWEASKVAFMNPEYMMVAFMYRRARWRGWRRSADADAWRRFWPS
jgi:hypothetical protein